MSQWTWPNRPMNDSVNDGTLPAPPTPTTDTSRLAEIASIIERVDNRCMAADGPVTRTLDEMTQEEISRIYSLSKGEKK